MWRLLPLSIQQIVWLLLVQIIVLGVGALWIMHWNKSSKISDMRYRIDIQSDFIDDLIYASSGKLEYLPRAEDEKKVDYRYDFDLDSSSYFLLVDDKRDIIGESSAAPPNTRKIISSELIKNFSTSNRPEKNLHEIKADGSRWMIQINPITRFDNGITVKGTLYVALNAESIFRKIEFFNRIVIFGALLILVLTASGSYVVLLYSTRNLRKFSNELQSFDPLAYKKISLTPNSFEEKFLFDSYKKMMAAIAGAIENQKIFIANATHELKTPLAASISALEVILSSKRSKDDYVLTCQEVLSELKSLNRLSNTLLNIAKLQNKSVRTEKTYVRFYSIIASLENKWRKSSDQKNISISTEVDKTILVAGTPESWEVVMNNLIDNAVKYGHTNGHIKIILEKTSRDLARILVIDDGKGMSEHELSQLGNIFFRADNARSDVGGSFGLGFSHVRLVVESLEGEISATSAVGVGTTIAITINGYQPDGNRIS